ncbi:MAG TPA: glutathione-dependent reductase [Chloroflexi bacterium]|jgi:putative glutathione S-transferase|nr:glutathione-dependent reductase [Chloroflexota bacterium]
MTTQAPEQTREGAETRGAFVRGEYPIQGRFSADGSSGFKAEPGRYHLYVSLACPWAHRSMIVRRLLGLEDVISLSVVDPVRDEHGWAFTEGFSDPVNGFQFLSEAYLRTDPDFSARFTVPCIWDRQTGRLVTNNFPYITTDFETEFKAFHKRGAPDLYPEGLRREIDRVSEGIYHDVNNGVYKCGFAVTQEAYEDAFDALFARLEELEDKLGSRRYLAGDQLTEADIRLWVTLARFDAVYHGHFKCNKRKLIEYPNLWAYARDLYSRPEFRETTDFDQIKRHYYMTHPTLNPSRIVPKGPDEDWNQPHGREVLP